MVLTVVFWRSRRPFDAHCCVSTLMNVTYAKILIERDKSIHECRFMNECIFAFVLMKVYFLVMNNKRCN